MFTIYSFREEGEHDDAKASLPRPFTRSEAHLWNHTFHSFQPDPRPIASQPLLLSLSLPVGDLHHLPFVEVTTTIAVWIGALWVGWCAFSRLWNEKVKAE